MSVIITECTSSHHLCTIFAYLRTIFTDKGKEQTEAGETMSIRVTIETIRNGNAAKDTAAI